MAADARAEEGEQPAATFGPSCELHRGRRRGRLISAGALLALALAACGQATPSPATPSPATSLGVCVGATDGGVRQRLSFKQIVPCLDTPSKVSVFMANNMTYDIDYDTRVLGGNEYDPAWLVYQRGIDDADGHAILQCYLLEENGWALVLGMSIESPTGSNACAVLDADGSIVVLEGAGAQEGPFTSYADPARHFVSIGWMQAGGTLRTLKASEVTQVTTDRTTPSVLQLPWAEKAY